MKNNKRSMSKIVQLLVAMACLTTNVGATVIMQNESAVGDEYNNVKESGLIINPDFEMGNKGWNLSGASVINDLEVAKSQMTVTASSEEIKNNDLASKAIDGDPSTIWHTKYSGEKDLLPQDITLDLGGEYLIDKYDYYPRINGGNGVITKYELLVSTDGKNFTKVTEGNLSSDDSKKTITFKPVKASHVRLVALEGIGGFAAASELGVFKNPESIGSSESYEGNNRVQIDTGINNKISQKITIPKTAYYNLEAYVKTSGVGGKMEIQNNENQTLAKIDIPSTEEYTKIELLDVPIEINEEVTILFTGAEGNTVDIDGLNFIDNIDAGVPQFNNILNFKVEGQSKNTVINKSNKTINFTVPYKTDVTKLNITELEVSEGAIITPNKREDIDFTKPVEFKVLSASGEIEVWTVTCTIADRQARATSSNKLLEESFNWSLDKTKQFVMTGKSGIVNKDENRPNGDGTGVKPYIPSYWAGYYDRTAFYSRDFVHQATGAQISGLDLENFSMYKTFAINATEARKWYTLWAINFDGSPHTIDYKDDTNFVREVPAQFELVEKAYEQYLWTGDERYIYDEDLWNFYTKVMTDYIALHDDKNPNGIAEGKGSIFQGSATYNERGEYPIEAGDAIGSQYQATLAYAGMLEARGETEEAKVWNDKAAELKRYFNEEWSVIDQNNPNENYARILDKNGQKKNDFGKENSWFIPMKMLTEPGERNDNYLDYISEKLGDGIGTTPEAPNNIEAYTYIPETYFPYNRNEEAWKWMKYIMSKKDLPHERPSQGTNGDYPEISYTFVSQTVEGLMGVEPNAPNHSVVTASHLVDEIDWLEVEHIEMGDHIISLRHDDLTKSKLTNTSKEDLTWEARFYGDYKYINVDGEQVEAEQKEVNGELVSYTNVALKENGTSIAEATNVEAPQLPDVEDNEPEEPSKPNESNDSNETSTTKPSTDKTGNLPNTGEPISAIGLGVVGTIITGLGFVMRKKRK